MTDPISLPPGGGAVRAIGDTFQPDLHTGTGNLTVPIELPPGRGSLAPKLSLSYSSGSGNGPFGIGWQLPVPGVRRKTEKRLPRYDGSDVFVISGAEDLVAVRGSADADVSRYRPKTESLFARIEHHTGGTDHWKVWTKDGLVSFYGTARPANATADWRDPAAIYDPDEPSRVCDWLLSGTVDTFGNRIEYTYGSDAQDPSGAQRYLTSIGYGDYDDSGTTQFLVHVRFGYEARPDVHTDRRRGFAVRTALRCHTIETWTHADDEQRSRGVNLSYSDSSDRPGDNGVSLLTSITVVGYDGETTQAMPPLEFSYSTWDPSQRRYQSVTGHGLPTHSLSDKSLDLVDLFGQGLPDVVQLSGGIGRYWRNRGDGSFDLPRQLPAAPAGVSLGEQGTQIMDADGDGRPDVLVTAGARAGYFPIDATATFAPHDYVGYSSAPSFGLSDPDTRLIDLDGDGIADALRLGTTSQVYLNKRDFGWVAQPVDTGSPLLSLSLSDPRIKLADMSGDGLTDVVLVANGSVRYWPNLGYGLFGAPVTMSDSPRFDDASSYGSAGLDPARLLVGDVDGDGCADIVYVGNGSTTIWLNRTGQGFAPPTVVRGTPTVDSATNVRLVDLLGSGTAGILWSFNARLYGDSAAKFLDLTGGSKPYLLTDVDNHMGGRTTITYAPSTAYALADVRAGAPWRTTLPFPVHVVASMVSTEHFSGSFTSSVFSYHHGYWDGVDREFRGFARVERFDTTEFDAQSGLPPEHYCPPTMLRSWFHVGPVGDEATWSELDLSDEYWRDDSDILGGGDRSALPSSLGRRQLRDVVRAFRGKPLRTELYGLDGTDADTRPYTVTEHCYDVLPVIDAPAGESPGAPDEFWLANPVISTPASGERTTQWERGNEPLTQATFTSGFDAYGNSRVSLHVAVPRGRDISKPGAALLAIVTTTDHAIRDDATHYLCDKVACARREEIRDDGTRTLAQLRDAVALDDDLPIRLLALQRVFYDGDPFVGLPAGTLGDHGLPKLTATLAVTPETLASARADATWAPYVAPGEDPLWGDEYPAEFRSMLAPLAGYRYEAGGDGVYEPGFYTVTGAKHDIDDDDAGRGLTVVTRDALGHDTTLRYDSYAMLPASVTDAARLTHSATYDYRTLKPTTITDANGNVTRAAYTPLGMTAWTANLGKPGVNEGNTAEQPGTLYSYGLTAFDDSPADRRQPTWAHTTRRVDHRWNLVDDANAARAATGQPPLTDAEIATMFPADEVSAFPERFLQSRAYNDGAGRVLQTRALADTLAVDTLGLTDMGAAGDFVVRHTDDPANPEMTVSGPKSYDNKGNVVKEWEPYFDAGWSYRPPDGATASQLACATTYYDPRGQAVRVEHPDGSVDIHVFGVPADLANPDVFTPTPWERYDYDRNDNAGRTHGASSSGWSSHWNTPSSVVLDALGRAVSTTRRLPGVESTSHNEYDIDGNLIRATDALGRVISTAIYDARKRAWAATSLDAGATFAAYDAKDSLIEHRDAKGAVILTLRDEIDRAVAQWASDRAEKPTTLRTFAVYGDDEEAGLSANDAASANLLGRPYRGYDEAGLVETPAYDLGGHVLSQRRQVFSTATLCSSLPTGGAGWDDAAYAADWQPASGQTRATLAESLLDPTVYTTQFRWDAVGRRTRVVAPIDAENKRRVVTATYSRGGKLATLAVDGVSYISLIAYNAREQRLAALQGNGILTRYRYDPATFRLARQHSQAVTAKSATTWSPTGAVALDQAMSYDLVGNPLTVVNSAPGSGVPGATPDQLRRDFSYDALYRLVGATGREHIDPLPEIWSATPRGVDVTATRGYTESYSYDEVDNLLALTHTAGDAGFTRSFARAATSNQLSRLTIGADTFDYTYDPCGNLAAETTSRHFSWDASNRLAAFRVQAGESAPPSQFTQYRYDPTGARVLKLVRNQGGTQELTIYPGSQLERLVLVDAAGNSTIHDELRIADGDATVAVVRIGDPVPGDQRPATAYHLTDRLGSGVTLLDEAGALVNREEYSPYGETTFGSCARKRYRFTGRERDGESGLSYHGARYYAPWLARWISCDPLGITQGPSLYHYAHGNPVGLIDTNGMAPKPAPDHVQLPKDAHEASEGELGRTFRADPFSLKGLGALAKGLKLWFDHPQDSKGKPMSASQRFSGFMKATELETLYALGFGQNSAKSMAGEQVKPGSIKKELGQDALACVGPFLTFLHMAGTAKELMTAGEISEVAPKIVEPPKPVEPTEPVEPPKPTKGANGALRDPKTGRFAPNPDRPAPKVASGAHGNARASTRPTYLYRLEDLDGNYLKTGISSDPNGRYSQDFMSDKFMRLMTSGSRSEMLNLERFIVEIDPGPLNFEPWAGKGQK